MSFVVSFAHVLAVTEAVPAETLAVANQPQLNRGWFNELGVHGLTPERLLAFEVSGSKDKVFIPAVRALLPQLNQLCS
jgi:hypothetical protein